MLWTKYLLIPNLPNWEIFCCKLSGEASTIRDDAVAKATGVKQIESDLIW
jgi:glutamate-5-semialdehyde dehydrogenase